MFIDWPTGSATPSFCPSSEASRQGRASHLRTSGQAPGVDHMLFLFATKQIIAGLTAGMGK
jgi:hypothetical protein